MHKRFMQRAIALAVENTRQGGGPFAALVVRDGAVIAEGVNQVTATNDPTAHAEVVAIRAACAALGCFQLTGCALYASCEPCPMCLGAIYWARAASVYYAATARDAAAAGFDDSFIYEQFALPPVRRKIPMRQILRAEALAALREWERKPGKVEY